jgi:hypothetical protein
MKVTRNIHGLILIGATIVLVVALIFIRKGAPPAPGAGGAPKAVPGEIVPFEKSGIPQEALKSTDHLAGDGMKTVLSHDYQPGTPLVEISFLKRNADGTTEPFALSTVEILSADGRGPSIGLDGAHGLREDVTRDPNSRRGMMRGKTYKIASYIPVGGHTGIKTAPLDPVFQVPEDLPPNSVFRVKLIIKDEMAEQQALARG